MLATKLLCCALLLTAGLTYGIESDTNTVLLLHFNSTPNGQGGETPSSVSGLSYEPGVNAQAARFSGGNQLYFPAAGNLNATNGTLEFWIRPAWNGSDGQGHVVLSFGGGGGLLFFKDGGNYWRIIGNRYGSNGRPEVGAGINISTEWRSNEWHHAAFTWTPQAMKVYVDGQLRSSTTVGYLPPITASSFQIGAEGSGSPAEALLDELRISDRERSAAEIQQSFLADVIISGLSTQPTATNLLKSWWCTPSLTATTSVGNIQVPAGAATWTSSNTNIAAADAAGRIVARGTGSALLTATLNGKSANLTVKVSAPVREAEIGPIDPALAAPATNALYDMPVLVINYIPTLDGINTDPAILDGSSIASFKAKLGQLSRSVKFMLEEGSRYHGYSNAAARPSLGYRVVQSVTAYEVMPPGSSAGNGWSFPNYNQILERFNLGALVTNLNVKEVWLWGYHAAGIAPVESDMASPTTGDISNSYRDPSDLPVFDRTYVLYHYNSMRSQAEAVHDHGHQLEAILSYVSQAQDGNSDLFWKKFCGQNPDGSFQPGRCGNTHWPPNGTGDYDYLNLTAVPSDCMDWTPGKTGRLSSVSANTWGNLTYNWPGGASSIGQRTESQYYIFWMQNMPGYQNGIVYGTNVMANWWEFTADWDNAVRQHHGLYRTPRVALSGGGAAAANGSFNGRLAGDAGFNYTIEATADFINWTGVKRVTNFSGDTAFLDGTAAPHRFYRARQTP